VLAVTSSALTRPARRTGDAIAHRKASSSLWVTSSTVQPEAARRRITSNREATSGGVSTAVGSSSTKHACAAVERLQDLEPLAYAHRQRGDARIRIDREVVLCGEPRYVLPCPACMDEGAPSRLALVDDILPDGKRFEQFED